MSINWGRQAVLSLPNRFFRPLNLLIVIIVEILIILPGLNLFSPDGTGAGTSASATAALTGLNAKSAPNTVTSQIQAASGFKKNPLGFEINRGQFDPQVKFLAHGPGYSLLLGANRAVLAFRDPTPAANHAAKANTVPAPDPAQIELTLAGANPAPQVTGLEEQAAKSHYFTGSDPADWQTNVPHFRRVQYKDIYPGVDLVYYGNSQDQLEYDFVVAPGADPAQIKLEFTGASSLEVTPQGDLRLALPTGNLTQPAPNIYQEKDGKREPVKGSYRLSGPLDNRVSFDLKDYDPAFPLVIDPVITYASYFGGGDNDFGYGIAVDSGGNTYITGSTVSTDFPMQSGLDTSFGGGTVSGDAFVSKFSPSGTLLYSTYLGGSGEDSGIALAVDSSGNFYVTGNTNSGNFPFSVGAFQTTFGGGSGSGDAFVTKFNATGDTLVYSTYLGGSNDETAKGIALDGSNNFYVTGTTNGTSNDNIIFTNNFPVFPVFPTPNPLQGTFGGGSNDAYVAKFNSNNTIAYSSYLGGNGSELAGGIAVDSSGNTYLTGGTTSTNFVIMNPYQATPHGNGDRDLFVTKLTSSGALAYSTYLGGSGEDNASGIGIDSDGNFIVTGTTISDDFPTKNAYLSLNDGFEHVFVTKFNAAGTLAYSTYLGGDVTDFASGIAVDFLGNAYITGNTYSDDFPTLYATQVQDVSGGGSDAFITQFNADGSLGFSTYLGGGDDDYGTAIAVDTGGNAYLTGYTASPDFPVTDTSTLAGTNDAILVKLNVIIVVTDNNPATVETSLRNALTQASANGGAVAFGPSVTTTVAITGNLNLPANVSLTGRSCGPSHGQVQLTGSGNLVFQGNNSITGLKLQGMKLTNIVSTSPLTLGKGNKVKCSTMLGA